MSGSLSDVVGYELEDKPVSWNRRDLLLYALGIGAKRDDYQFVYELDPMFTAVPTYPVVLRFKLDDTDVNLFVERFKAPTIPGMPPSNPKKTVHATESIEILKPLPPVSGAGWKWKTRFTGVAENKSGIILTTENTLVSPTGEVYAKIFSSSFNLGATATGQKFSKYIAGPPEGKAIPKERRPNWVVTDQTTEEQAILYRLSGDYNPLHIDPKIGQAAGFGGAILHGLSTFGFAARAVLKTAGNNDPTSLKFFGVRFTAPVKPGDELETSVWEVGVAPNGTVELAFQTKDTTTGKVVLGNGVAYVAREQNAKL